MATVPIRLTLNAVGVKQGERDVTAAFNKIKTGAKETANTVDAATTRMGRGMSGLTQRVAGLAGKMDGQTRFVFQNTANQLGDIAVQASMGTNMFRVLGMQLPQIAGGFAVLGGSMGVVAGVLGVVAAIGFPIIATFTSMGGEAKTTADKVDDLSAAVDGLSATARMAKTPIQQLYDEYGVLGREVRSAADAAAEFDAYLAAQTARNLATQLTAGMTGTVALGADFAVKVRQSADALVAAGRDMNSAGFSQVVTEVTNLSERLGVAADEAVPVYEALQNINDAGTDEALAAAYLELSTALSKITPETQETAAKISEWQKNAFNAGTELSRVLEFIRQIKENGTLTIDIAYSQTMGMTFADNPNWMAGLTPEQLLPPKPRETRSRGRSAIEKERDELKRFADGIKPVLTLLQEYEQNMTKLNRAKEIGAITSEQFAQKEALLTEQFQYASGAMVDYTSVANTFANSLENSLMAMVDGTMSVQDAFKSMATAVIKELFRVLVVQQLVNNVMGAFGYQRSTTGNFIKSFDGGGYTGAGPRSGGLDGKGGFMAMLHPNETVVDHTKGQSGGGSVVVNQTINVSAGVAQTVRAEMQNMLPAFKQQATQGVLDAKRRGGAYGGSFA